MSTETDNFLESLLWALPEDHTAHKNGWSVHEFHPEFRAAVSRFIYGFRAYLQEHCPDLDPDAGGRSFGGNVYFSLSGHGCGFWDDRDAEWGQAMQSALEAFVKGDKYRFEQIGLMKFSGKIHFALRTAAFRREELAKVFGNTLETSAA